VTKFPDLSATLEKLGALFKRSSQNDWVRIDFSPWGSEPNDDNKFLNIKMAILNQKVVSFDYLSSLEEKTERTVEPLQLIYKGQAWYLLGWCRNKEDQRLFRISRIKKLGLKRPA
jgi:predicted DNA-binding transcriptional regulator YafY